MSSQTSLLIILALTLLLLSPSIQAHSQMTCPQSTAPMTCRRGGEPQFGVENCHGPCDMRAINGGYAIHASTANPAATYSRGQVITVKYQRNNHAPGGFTRLTIVEPGDMMNKAAHARNAFHYSCWGANAVRAKPSELGTGRFGYSFVGSDGEQHSLPKGYYTSKVRIPTCIPDGDYILGWVWYGGTGGGTVENNGPAKVKPAPYGYFSDYWSCSFIKIRGGPMEKSYTPVFVNDMKQFSKEGCMSANDAVGVCSYEPCHVTGRYQRPREFKSGTPKAITAANFGGSARSGSPGRSPARPPPKRPAPKAARGSSNSQRAGRKSCRCLVWGENCPQAVANLTRGYCRPNTLTRSQPSICRSSCCSFCRQKRNKSLCKKKAIRKICRF